MAKGLRIAVDGTVTDLDNVEYDTIREAIGGGWLEGKSLPSGNFMYMDEEGKLKGFSHNPLATILVGKNLLPGDYIVGAVVIAGPDDGEGDHIDVPADFIEDVKSRATLI